MQFEQIPLAADQCGGPGGAGGKASQVTLQVDQLRPRRQHRVVLVEHPVGENAAGRIVVRVGDDVIQKGILVRHCRAFP
ncbi:MAG: hypothetical protein U0736_12530 [Gemmataceae bacterium]